MNTEHEKVGVWQPLSPAADLFEALGGTWKTKGELSEPPEAEQPASKSDANHRQ